MSNEKIEGVSAADMSLADLKQLCKENNLDIKGKTSKKDILEVVHAWENSLSEKTDADLKDMGATITMRKHKGAEISNVKAVSFHEGKLVVSRTPLDLNGVAYEDIVVEGGVTYRVPVIK